MATPIYHIPRFDKLELELVPEILFTRQEKLAPVFAGSEVAGLTTERNHGKWHPYFDEIVLDTTANFLRYTHKPLLLYFYEKDWGQVGIEHLRQLNAAHTELRRSNVNVLVVTSGSLTQFRSLSWREAWQLEAYEDPSNELASLLKIYSEQGPSWSRYAGIERNVPLPALYLLDYAGQIAFGFPNEIIGSKLPLEEVIQTLLYNEKCPAERKSA